MTNQEQQRCDLCHERPAMHYACYGQTGETRALCMTCFKQTASVSELESFRHSEEVILKGKCKYCGAPAVGGSICCAIPGATEDETDLWCESCRLDLVEFGSRPENAFPDFDPEDEARLKELTAQLAERTRREEEFMRQRVRER